ncbi:MAG: hypothetical protein R2790_02205 [Flavobacterium haoranii]
MDAKFNLLYSDIEYSYAKQKDKEYVYTTFKNLFIFSYSKNLLKLNLVDEFGNFDKERMLTNDDFTELGLKIFEELMFKWLTYTGNDDGKIDRINNIKMLEKYYNKLTKEK